MKGRLREPSLPSMKVAFAGQESFPEQTLGALERTPLHKFLVVRDQYVLDVVRVVEKENVLRAKP
jgi:hypothetical protein